MRVHGDATTVGDEEALTRVFLNLVANAVRHCRASVDVHLSHQDGAACALVVDDGPGFPPEMIGDSFERFATRYDGRRPGAGLGLAIASAIVKAHGGTLATGSVEDGGGAVTVRLPAWRHDSSAPQTGHESRPHPAVRHEPRSG